MKTLKGSEEYEQVGDKMRIGTIFNFSLCIILAFSSVVFHESVRTEESSTTTVFTDPLMVQPTDLGQNFVVNINVSNVVDLYGWQTGITFNPVVLDCTGFFEGEFLKRSNETTLFVSHYKDMNNTLGIVYFRGNCLLGPVSGVDGSGQLAYATFKSIATGVSDFHLTDVVLLNSNLEEITFEVAETFTVPLFETNYPVGIADNLTGENSPANPPLSGMFGTVFNAGEKEVSFDAFSMNDWFCELEVPKTLLRSSSPSGWTVKVDGASVPYTATENDTHTLLYFEHGQGSHTVEIIGTEVATPLPESPMMLVALLGLASLALVFLGLKRRKVSI